MKTFSAMFQKILLLAALAAFTKSATPPPVPTSANPSPRPRPTATSANTSPRPTATSANPSPTTTAIIPPCEVITSRLQNVFRPLDPYTFHNISHFIYISGDTRLSLNFVNLLFEGFSGVSCSSTNLVSRQNSQIVLAGRNLEFSTRYSEADGYLNRDVFSLISQVSLQVPNYVLELSFNYDSYQPDPFSLCIINGSLHLTFRPTPISVDIDSRELIQELDTHATQVADAINLYLPRFANGLTQTLIEQLCHPTITTRRPQ